MCERIPYLILPVRQLSREPFGSRRSVRRSAEPKRYMQAIWHGTGHESHHPPKRRYAKVWRVRRQWIGKEMEGYVRGSRV